jgi:hypothetical protein
MRRRVKAGLRLFADQDVKNALGVVLPEPVSRCNDSYGGGDRRRSGGGSGWGTSHCAQEMDDGPEAPAPLSGGAARKSDDARCHGLHPDRGERWTQR